MGSSSISIVDFMIKAKGSYEKFLLLVGKQSMLKLLYQLRCKGLLNYLS